ncbi:MAG: DUF1428 domain-containing protein [Rhodospirillaceae bacterium]|nr:DUF1428 domain-containing protein [Rhodospirillaceae bacterium]
MTYVDGFVIPVPKKNKAAYSRMAREGREIWLEHGATGYLEAIGDDTPWGKRTSFPRSVKLKKSETVWFSFILYKSRKHRDAVMKKVMADKRMAKYMTGKVKMPFDPKRMIVGGFKAVVEG